MVLPEPESPSNSTKERMEAAMRDAVPYTVHIDSVRYVDFDNDPIDRGDIDA